jgi:hypothetical protein
MAAQSKQSLLEDMIAAVPKREREADALMAIANAADTVFPPAVRARPRLLVRKRFPRRSARALVLANCSPLPFGKVRPPALPMLDALLGFLKALFFGGHRGEFLSGPVKGIRPVGPGSGKYSQKSREGRTHLSSRFWRTSKSESTILDIEEY